MAISSGGVLGEQGDPGCVLKGVMRRISKFAPRASDEDYVLDLGFYTWRPSLGPVPSGGPTEPGVRPWMVGRKQRRFIVELAPPPGLDDEESLLAWLVPALNEAADLCRVYLPTKSRHYPAEELALEAEALAVWLTSTRGD